MSANQEYGRYTGTEGRRVDELHVRGGQQWADEVIE